MRNKIFDKLSKLDATSLDILLFKANVPSALMPGENTPPAKRIIAVIEYLESKSRLFVLDWLSPSATV